MTHVAIDQLRTHTMLETEATYRVASVLGDQAVMRVVDVPGLPVGMEVRMKLDAVCRMSVVDVRAEVERGLAGLLAPSRPVERAA